MENSPATYYYPQHGGAVVKNFRPRKRLNRLCAESEEHPPNKQLVTEERMAEHMKKLSIDQPQGFQKTNPITYQQPSPRQPFYMDRRSKLASPPYGDVVIEMNGKSDNEELVSLLRNAQECRVPVIQLTPPTPVQASTDSQKPLSNQVTVIDDFESSDEEYEESEEFLQIAPDVKEHMKSKHAELISSAIVKSMRNKPCMDVVLWTPQDKFISEILQKVHVNQCSQLKSDDNYLDECEDDPMNMDT